ncbi:hypothetical protein NDI44_21880 [Trichocoleus sp. DQ-A3]|uniref:hypothetical protein n=1 Tax=Cyanophyceae TaxID=3028117 RepID=UPI00168A2F2C|nr:hypothetical protein [Coleofasciculus sp. FACHB-125]MBD1898598.1 hypothetical protein [Coleofasciculus sp. FACHB-125]
MGRLAPESSRTIRKQQRPDYRPSPKVPVKVIAGIYFSILLSIFLGVLLLSSGRMTIGGVPLPILMSFLSDDAARNAYLAGEPAALHDRLEVMGIEEQIKEYYRPQISDEAKLDQHIHQILYDRTGYVGAQYEVNPEGVLVLKNR